MNWEDFKEYIKGCESTTENSMCCYYCENDTECPNKFWIGSLTKNLYIIVKGRESLFIQITLHFDGKKIKIQISQIRDFL